MFIISFCELDSFNNVEIIEGQVLSMIGVSLIFEEFNLLEYAPNFCNLFYNLAEKWAKFLTLVKDRI